MYMNKKKTILVKHSSIFPVYTKQSQKPKTLLRNISYYLLNMFERGLLHLTWGNLFNKILIKAFLQLQFNPCLARIFLILEK